MTDILIQFHALAEEMLDVTRAFARDEGVHVSAMRFPPPTAQSVGPFELEKTFEDMSVSGVAFTIDPPRLPAAGSYDFLKHNPDALLLEIGRLESGGLRESALSARTENTVALAKWRILAKRLRKILRAGATAVNPDSGATARLRNHRFSSGAKSMQQRGTPMLPAAGGALIMFDD
jgi:hypothetical protein